MRLRAGEVQNGGSEAVRLDHSQVDLKSFPGDHRRLGVASTEHPLHQAHADERLHDRHRVSRGCQHVDVADGLVEPPQAAAAFDRLHFAQSFQHGHDLFGQRQGVGDRSSPLLAV